MARTLRDLQKALPPRKAALTPQPTVLERKPVPNMPGWTAGYDHKNDMIHFNHVRHGAISVKRNPNPRAAGEFPFVATHNSASVGRYRNPQEALLSVQKYATSLPEGLAHARLFNIPSQPVGGIDPTKAHRLMPKIKKSSNEYFRELLSKSKDKFVCLLNFDEQINESLNKAISDALANPNLHKHDEPEEPELAPESEAATAPKGPHRSYKLLTDEGSNAKTAKNINRQGFVSAILHLAPADLSGCANVCPGASEGCRQACLNTAGRGGMISRDKSTNVIQDARVRKTIQLVTDPDAFFKNLDADLHKLKKYAKKEGKTAVARLNGTSDVDWAAHRPPIWNGKNVFEAHPDIQYYDYTKMPGYVTKNKHPNYHITFSRSEKNEGIAQRLLGLGHNVAVVFGGKQLPEKYLGFPVISGDDHDLRFLDPRGGYVIGLKAKGDAKSDKSGFVVWGHQGDPTAQPKEQPGASKYARIKAARDKLRALKRAA